MATVGVKGLILCFGHVTQQHAQIGSHLDNHNELLKKCVTLGTDLHQRLHWPSQPDSQQLLAQRWDDDDVSPSVHQTSLCQSHVLDPSQRHPNTADRQTAAHIYNITSISLLLTHRQQVLSIQNNVFVCYISCFVRHGVSAMQCYSCFVFKANQWEPSTMPQCELLIHSALTDIRLLAYKTQRQPLNSKHSDLSAWLS